MPCTLIGRVRKIETQHDSGSTLEYIITNYDSYVIHNDDSKNFVP